MSGLRITNEITNLDGPGPPVVQTDFAPQGHTELLATGSATALARVRPGQRASVRYALNPPAAPPAAAPAAPPAAPPAARSKSPSAAKRLAAAGAGAAARTGATAGSGAGGSLVLSDSNAAPNPSSAWSYRGLFGSVPPPPLRPEDREVSRA